MRAGSGGMPAGPDHPGHEQRDDVFGALIERGIDRKRFLKLGGAGIAGVMLAGSIAGSTLGLREAFAQAGAPTPSEDLAAEFEEAAREYGVPAEVLAAMGYVNTRWEMPPPELSAYEDGDPHGWGGYGIMALVQNPSTNTLGEASELTGIPEEELKTNRRSNILGGAALLSQSQGSPDPEEPGQWSGSVSVGPSFTDAPAGVGGGELYTEQVFAALGGGVGEGLASDISSEVRSRLGGEE